MVAAIDFGTTYSGYSFSMRDEFEKNALQIHTPVWKAGSRQFMSEKTPTCLLLNSEQKFEAFGFDAEDQWTELLLDGEEEDYYYFERFKMNLHNNKVLYIASYRLFCQINPVLYKVSLSENSVLDNSNLEETLLKEL